MSTGVSGTDLARLPLFAGVDPAELSGLAEASRRSALDEGEVLYRQGETASAVYCIVSGQLALRVDNAGRSTVVMTVGPGDLLGWAALQLEARSLTTARALSPVELVAMPADRLLDVLAAGSETSRLLIRRLFGFAATHLDGTRAQLLRIGSEGVISAG